MESVEKLTAAITMVEEARSVPLSASCVVHRAEMLEVLDEARESLPADFESAQKIIDARDANDGASIGRSKDDVLFFCPGIDLMEDISQARTSLKMLFFYRFMNVSQNFLFYFFGIAFKKR